MLVCFASPSPPHRSPQGTLKHFVQAIFKCLTSLLPLTSIKQKFFFTLLNPIMKQMLNYKAGQGISMAEKKKRLFSILYFLSTFSLVSYFYL